MIRRRALLFINVAGLVLVLGACGASDAGTTTDIGTTTDETTTRLEKARDAVRRQAQYIALGDNGMSLSIDGEGTGIDGTSGTDVGTIVKMLVELDTPDSVYSRMDNTTALQGLQEAEFDGLIMRWTYHPDNGLDIIIEDMEF